MSAKKTPALLLLLLESCALTLLIIMLSGKSAHAIEPTPTPPPPTPIAPPPASFDTMCHLALGQDCTLIDPLAQTALEAGVVHWLNPELGAQDVPTYTLISATFDREMDAASFTPETFYVTQADGRQVAGSLSYIEASKMAVFWPDAPLQAQTTYFATILPTVREATGLPLGQGRDWSFTTRSEAALAAAGVTPTDLLAQSGMNVYFGDLHNHTGYSDGVGTPAQAFATARANGVHFLAVTEHCFMMTPAEWADVKYQANAATLAGQFVALAGFEYTHLYGHINVFNSDTYIHSDDPNYDTLAEFYDWLIAQPTAFAQFNHPRKTPGFDMNFNDFAYNPQADLKMVLQELRTTDQFLLSLNTGWHLGSVVNHDRNDANWGRDPWMGAVATSLTKEAITEALLARRTFFVSPSDSNLNFALVMQANGYWMGSAIPNTSQLDFTINAYDPDPRGKPLRLFLYDNGVRVASASLSSRTVYTWRPTVTGYWGHYYYAEAYYDSWSYSSYSSPIWVEYPPIAEAGPERFVAPGANVNLDGRSSHDPDGDAVAYRWTQDSGPPGSLDNPSSAQPAFTAPATLGSAVLRLTVTDPGGLSAADTTTVTITNAPILAISKSGPDQTEPGELINYTLTVTNNGSTSANNVTITDAMPAGATYVNGGNLNGNIVSWTVPTLPANGESVSVTFTVSATGSVVNSVYGASCSGCIPATGSVPIYTNGSKFYFPVIRK